MHYKMDSANWGLGSKCKLCSNCIWCWTVSQGPGAVRGSLQSLTWFCLFGLITASPPLLALNADIPAVCRFYKTAMLTQPLFVMSWRSLGWFWLENLSHELGDLINKCQIERFTALAISCTWYLVKMRKCTSSNCFNNTNHCCTRKSLGLSCSLHLFFPENGKMSEFESLHHGNAESN